MWLVLIQIINLKYFLKSIVPFDNNLKKWTKILQFASRIDSILILVLHSRMFQESTKRSEGNIIKANMINFLKLRLNYQ